MRASTSGFYDAGIQDNFGMCNQCGLPSSFEELISSLQVLQIEDQGEEARRKATKSQDGAPVAGRPALGHCKRLGEHVTYSKEVAIELDNNLTAVIEAEGLSRKGNVKVNKVYSCNKLCLLIKLDQAPSAKHQANNMQLILLWPMCFHMRMFLGVLGPPRETCVGTCSSHAHEEQVRLIDAQVMAVRSARARMSLLGVGLGQVLKQVQTGFLHAELEGAVGDKLQIAVTAAPAVRF
ncbi:uncharacterized protein PSFLO_03658 [Pseudozyma flocculosa]|uniref:Uncharacterized protein n=1 Tax=Pseudozyma flocculosa TaxID=84751 RepID=A0A5C3F4N1_9BASI|nr:uncharacterized protein PSFLO_03658 [Pseudozyma flocculosa]